MKSVLLLSLLLFALGCSPSNSPSSTLTLATTTSARDSGLLDYLLPKFKAETGIEVRVVAVGSGQAMEVGRRGDADVLLSHAPKAEEKFVAVGWGVGRRPLMFNDFIVVGPADDPAKIEGETSIAAVFKKLAEGRAPFVTRGDDSGTHQKENAIWREAGAAPKGDWYRDAGSGMAATLRVADEQQAYTLTDRGTYLALRDKLQLKILAAGDPLLKNFYSVTLINPAKHPHVNAVGAQQLVDFLTSPAIQAEIAEFGVAEFGEPLFRVGEEQK